MVKINGSDHSGIRPIDSDKRSKQQAESSPVSNSSRSSADSVSLSDVKKTLEALTKLTENIPEINSKRVEILRATLGAGAYEIDSANIAKKMMAQG